MPIWYGLPHRQAGHHTNHEVGDLNYEINQLLREKRQREKSTIALVQFTDRISPCSTTTARKLLMPENTSASFIHLTRLIQVCSIGTLVAPRSSQASATSPKPQKGRKTSSGIPKRLMQQGPAYFRDLDDCSGEQVDRVWEKGGVIQLATLYISLLLSEGLLQPKMP